MMGGRERLTVFRGGRLAHFGFLWVQWNASNPYTFPFCLDFLSDLSLVSSFPSHDQTIPVVSFMYHITSLQFYCAILFH